jgi:hypothetical protein
MSLQARMSIHTVNHERATVTRGAAGGAIRPQAVIAKGLLCRIVPETARIDDPLMRTSVEYNHLGFFAFDPKCKPQDRFIGVSPATMKGRIFRVVGVKNPDFKGRFWRVELMEQEALQNGVTGA